MITWNAGNFGTQFIDVPIVNDNLVEGNETFRVLLTSPTGDGSLDFTRSTTTVTILDDDPAFTGSYKFSPDPILVSEGGVLVWYLPPRFLRRLA